MNTQNIVKGTFAALTLSGLILLGFSRHTENAFPVAVGYLVAAGILAMAAFDAPIHTKRLQ